MLRSLSRWNSKSSEISLTTHSMKGVLADKDLHHICLANRISIKSYLDDRWTVGDSCSSHCTAQQLVQSQGQLSSSCDKLAHYKWDVSEIKTKIMVIKTPLDGSTSFDFKQTLLVMLQNISFRIKAIKTASATNVWGIAPTCMLLIDRFPAEDVLNC